MPRSKSSLVKVSPEELMPLFGDTLSRSTVKGIIENIPGVTLYWRVLTPLVILWCFILQRLNHDHSCDEIVSHLHTGAVDDIDAADPHPTPLSQRLSSESNAAYVQGRNRLPLALLQKASRRIREEMETWQGDKGLWKGLSVRLLDGTTFRLPPEGDLVATYGQSSNQYGRNHWVKVRALAAFDLMNQALVAVEEAAYTVGETALVYKVMQQDNAPQALYIGDANFGIYRVMQVTAAADKDGLYRLSFRRAKKLLKAAKLPTKLLSGSDHQITWRASRKDQVFPDLPQPPIVGRLIYVRVQEDGFRPFDVYLFTTLLEVELYPMADICALYCRRWQVEIDFRHIKTTLDMEYFVVKSAAMFRKELAAGLLTYNLICAFMLKAALAAHILPTQLSFSQCWRRVRDLLLKGVPRWVYEQEGQILTHFWRRLARCRIHHAHHKVLHEPRKVRRRPRVYPALKGSRADARQEVLKNMALVPNS